MADNKKRDQEDYFEDRAGTKDARFHVVPHDEEGWAVKREGETAPVCTSGSRDEAIEEAKRLAKDAGTIAYLHGDDGRIKEQLEYGND
ncbi:hypothetical protein OXB_1551 [Bacillus sp. OxB-1]|uniref:DUF2188 domain-containing protein n=1 Tax=Bacillus sp. (strain OxB-1) TaxID=98228 RepID=UPI000581D56F|nr:DUF2188 domain-containing protein [Bacillus sp. OxB-1]BAQ10022.1 hypothetical protein OXB_1551 [Bacillus sp. OxB-1]